VIVVKRGPNAGSRFRLDQPLTTAGRHPGSDIFLDDVTVSRRHAEFRLENGEFWVVDIDSLNGTYLNRKPVQSAMLANGDEIQIGKFRLVFLTRPTTVDTAKPLGSLGWPQAEIAQPKAQNKPREDALVAPPTTKYIRG